MRNLLQRRIPLPHRLHTHLREIHRAQGVQPRIAREHIDARGEEVEDLLEDEALVGDEVRREVDAGEVRLEEEEGFEVRGFVVDGGRVEFDGETVVEAAEEDVFVASDGHGFEFGRGGDDFEEAFEFGAFFEGEGVDFDCDICMICLTL